MDKNTSPLSSLGIGSRFLWAFITLTSLIALLSFFVGRQSNSLPSTDSPEAGFARDMTRHHAQAVNMAQLLYDNTEDPNMRILALDIMLTQQAQIGQMHGWLNVWEVPISSTTPAMNWMGMPTTELMPGMASMSDINRLRNLSGIEADVLFIQLMIPHHRSGVEMANAIHAYSNQPEVIALAQAIINSQANEINLMQTLLAEKGFEPVPEPEATEEHQHP